MKILAKIVTLVFCGMAGLIIGASLLYFAGGPIYLLYAKFVLVDASTECSRGNFVGLLLILVGALVGSIIGVKLVLRAVAPDKVGIKNLR